MSAPAAPAPAQPASPAAAPAAPPEPAPAKKAAKGKKTAAPIDATAVASAAATAATEAAVRVIQSTPAQPKAGPSDNLSDEDKRDYEVAAHLASLDPRYADAPKIILDHITRAEDYAARWEAANPGKEFNVNDDEHDDFFATLQRPWTVNDFNEARIDLAAEKKLKKFQDEQQGSMQGLHRDQARMELAPAVDRKFNDATTDLAKAVGDDIHKVLTTEGWDGLHKTDPVTAQVLATTLDQMHPFIQAAIEIDDPRQRVPLDVAKDPAHAQWNRVVTVGEASLTGEQDEQGRIFARRSDYLRMSPAQQATHWYLTTEMIIKGALDYAADQVVTVSKAQKDRLASLGFVRQTPAAAAGAATPPTPAAVPPPAAAAVSAAEKPISPSVGSGAKIDDAGGAAKTGDAALLQKMSDILFRK